jgi:hypothetical protein
MKRVLKAGAAVAGAAAGTYGAWAALAYVQYGRVPPRSPDEHDELLDRVMPAYDVYEHHQIRIAAPHPIVFAAACEQDLLDLPLVRAIFDARALVMGGTPDTVERPRGVLPATLSLGWRVLAEVADREVVVGAVTRPWEADVVFRGLPSDQFAAFAEPAYVKIVWTLRADPLPDGGSRFVTETRAVATDDEARRRFRRYWAFASPGISMIRRLGLPALKRQAERLNRSAPSPRPSEPAPSPVR